jgi:hypothetical protein
MQGAGCGKLLGMFFDQFGWERSPHSSAEAYGRALAILDGTREEPAAEEVAERLLQLKALSLRKRGEGLSGSPRCELELLVLQQSTDEALAQQIPELRREFALVKSRAPEMGALPARRPALLAEARFLTLEILRHRELQGMFVRSKASTIRRIALPLLLAFPVAAGLVWLSGHTSRMRDATVLVVMLSGACGGFVSLCRRIEAKQPGPDLAGACQAFQANGIGLIAKPLLGGAFALVLYLLILGGMVTGSLFPTIHVGDATMSFYTFFNAQMMAGPGDFAKLLVWSFLAGFAERLVPDMLGQVAGNSAKETEPAGRDDS